MELLEPDEYLYDRVKQGDLGAFDILYERYQRGLFRFIYSYLKNKEESEEAFHEAFIQIFKTVEKVEFDSGSFKGWIYRIARNICLNRLRSKKRGIEALVTYQAEPALETSEPEYLKSEFAEKVIAAAEALPKPMLELFNMRRVGMAYLDISQALGIPIGTVKSRLHALIETLKLGLK